jgi:hypothetical protein
MRKMTYVGLMPTEAVRNTRIEARRSVREFILQKESSSFCEQKEAKKL